MLHRQAFDSPGRVRFVPQSVLFLFSRVFVIWGTDLLFSTSDILSMFIHFVFFNFNLLICVESQVALCFYGKKCAFCLWKH